MGVHSERARLALQVGAVLAYVAAAVLLVVAFLDYWGEVDAPTLGLWPDRTWLFFLAIPFLALGGLAGWYGFRRPGEVGGSVAAQSEGEKIRCTTCGSPVAAMATVCSQCSSPL